MLVGAMFVALVFGCTLTVTVALTCPPAAVKVTGTAYPLFAVPAGAAMLTWIAWSMPR